jgi:hypothetical protein
MFCTKKRENAKMGMGKERFYGKSQKMGMVKK